VTGNLNSGLFSRSPLYIWVKRARTEEEAEHDAILEVCLTTGTPFNREDKIWTPPSREYVRVDGNLNHRWVGDW